ncbi:DUF721 domain-containing protein [Streptomyces sp. NPDC002599]|uniref:DUF721 domain-containing protein n=1 Tax=Streptomyces sp. NPDC002599 TaxID=3154421 RepID=UPI00331A2B7E
MSGVGLARVALRAALEAVCRNVGSTRTSKPKLRTMSVVRRDGREPMGLGAAIGALVTERAWDVLAAGGTVLDRWPGIAAGLSPKLPDHVQAVTFHSETGQLDPLPALPAYATQLRLITPRIVAASNESAGTDVVRTVRVLPVGASPAPRAMEPAPTAAPEAP